MELSLNVDNNALLVYRLRNFDCPPRDVNREIFVQFYEKFDKLPRLNSYNLTLHLTRRAFIAIVARRAGASRMSPFCDTILLRAYS